MVHIFQRADFDEVGRSSLLLLLDREPILVGGLRAFLAGRCERHRRRSPGAGKGRNLGWIRGNKSRIDQFFLDQQFE